MITYNKRVASERHRGHCVPVQPVCLRGGHSKKSSRVCGAVALEVRPAVVTRGGRDDGRVLHAHDGETVSLECFLRERLGEEIGGVVGAGDVREADVAFVDALVNHHE